MTKRIAEKRPFAEIVCGLLYPKRCLFCHEILEDVDWERGICPDCSRTLPLVKEPICKRCGKELSDESVEYCPDCQKHRHQFEYGRALLGYTREVQGAIVRFKYKNQRSYAKWFGAQIAKHWGQAIRAMNAEALVPVPLYIKKEKQRGFNQAQLLAEEIGREVGLPVRPLLMRRRSTKAQKELGYEARMANLEDSFRLAPGFSALPRAVILVDDIYTTGSTMDACAAILKQAGVRRVFFLTIAIGKC